MWLLRTRRAGGSSSPAPFILGPGRLKSGVTGEATLMCAGFSVAGAACRSAVVHTLEQR